MGNPGREPGRLVRLLSGTFGLTKEPQYQPLGAIVAGTVVILIGLVIILLYSSQLGNKSISGVSAASLSLMLGLGVCLAGGLVGFVFGIPRALGNPVQRPDLSNEPVIASNTNLEQISDWITKIIVGVGLIQIREIATTIQRIVNFIAPALGGGASAQVFTFALLLYFSVPGFLISYISTRVLFWRVLEEMIRGQPDG